MAGHAQRLIVKNKSRASRTGIAIKIETANNAVLWMGGLKLKLQAGLLAHGSSPSSTFPDVSTQWSLEALPIYSGPTAQDLHLNSLFSPAISRGTWSHITYLVVQA
jgi:hypothetical protein